MPNESASTPLGEQEHLYIEGYKVSRVMSASPTPNSTDNEDHYHGTKGAVMIRRQTSASVDLEAREAHDTYILCDVLAGFKPGAASPGLWGGETIDACLFSNQVNEAKTNVVRSWIVRGANGDFPARGGAASDLMTRTTTLTGRDVYEINGRGITSERVALGASGTGYSGALVATPTQVPTSNIPESGSYALSVWVATASGTSIQKWATPPNCKEIEVAAGTVSSAGTVLITARDLSDAGITGTPSMAWVAFIAPSGVPSPAGLYE